MQIATLTLETLIRPRLMVVAARHGLSDYDRDRRLPRLLGLPVGRALPSHKAALEQLVTQERALEAARRHHDASWRASDHVAIMTALLHEAVSCLAANGQDVA